MADPPTAAPTTAPLWPRLLARLTKILEDYPERHMSDFWRRVLADQQTRADYVREIMTCIPYQVAELLDREKPPTLDQLTSLPRIATKDPGVYGHLRCLHG